MSSVLYVVSIYACIGSGRLGSSVLTNKCIPRLLTSILTDKLEDAKAKAAIKAQIEADKAERKARAEREKALRTGQPLPGSSSSAAPAPGRYLYLLHISRTLLLNLLDQTLESGELNRV